MRPKPDTSLYMQELLQLSEREMMDINSEHWPGYPTELAPGELDAQYNNIREIQFLVALRCGKGCDWIARHQDRDLPEGARWIGWGFVVNGQCLFVPHGDALHDPKDRAFIDRLAEEALGYPLHGREHLEALIAERRHWIALRDQAIKEAQRDKSAFLRQIDDYQEKLAALKRAE